MARPFAFFAKGCSAGTMARLHAIRKPEDSQDEIGISEIIPILSNDPKRTPARDCDFFLDLTFLSS
jgi:hypothetical protein